MNAFYEHLNRIIKEAPPQNEIQDAERFLSDSFPLRIETPAKIAKMIANLRIFGLPDDYWDTFRQQIRSVTRVQSLEAARKYIKPDSSLIVVVGRAADIAGPLREYGPITVVDTSGKVLQEVGAKEPGTQ